MFKNIQTTFEWKNSFMCESFNVITIKTDVGNLQSNETIFRPLS